jgi:hypothetical protein
MASTVFERIPEFFVVKYDAELCAWGRNFQKIGEVKHVVLEEGVFADASPNTELGPVLLRVALRARVTRSGATWVDGAMRKVAIEVTVTPDTEEDERLIRNHCQKLVALGVDPRKKLNELPRAGLPFMPNRYTTRQIIMLNEIHTPISLEEHPARSRKTGGKK